MSMFRVPLLITALLCACLVQNARAQAKSNTCLGKRALERLNECPAGLGKHRAGKEHKPVLSRAPKARGRTTRKAGRQHHTPRDFDFDRDERAGSKRRYEMLIFAVKRLERLVQATPRKAPDRLALMKRLADDSAELAREADRRALEREHTAQVLRKQAKRAAAAKQRAASRRFARVAKHARQGAIRYYTRIAREYPSYSKVDAVLYYLAFEHEQAGDLKRARQAYFELLQKAPQSRYVPRAYLAFGELFFTEATGDPGKWNLAAQAYREVLKFPPPRNTSYGYARYKLGYVYWNTEDHPQALHQFKRVIEFAAKYPHVRGATHLARAARRDLIAVYAKSGRADQAYGFVRPLSGDGAGDTTRTLAMLDELGRAYLDIGRYAEAITLYRDLGQRDPGAAACHYQTQVSIAVSALYSGDKPRIRRELDRQLQVRRAYLAENHSAARQLACSNQTAALVAETAMSWHLEAHGSGGVRGTRDPKTMDLASALYDSVIEHFTSEEFAKFEFPRILREDWPTLYRIKYARADLLYFRERWSECGPAFAAVVDEDPTGPDSADAAATSALCYQKVDAAAHAGQDERREVAEGDPDSSRAARWERLKPRPLTKTQRAMIRAFDRYLCAVPEPKSGAARTQYVEIKYARARAYFEAQHWEEAALAFRDVALSHGDHDAGIFAAHLYLEAVNVLRGHADPPRRGCRKRIEDDVVRLAAQFCTEPTEEVAQDCARFTQIECDVRRLRAESLVARADADQGNAARVRYEQAAEVYLGIWRRHGAAPLEQGEAPRCQQMDEILYNLARAYQASGLLAKSMRVRHLLIDPNSGLHETELAQLAHYELGQNYQAIAVYERAAEFFERYSEVTKYRGEHAQVALSDAVVLRLGLAQHQQAMTDARAFSRHLGRRHPAQAARIAFAVAAHHGQSGSFRAALEQLRASRAAIDRHGELDVRTEAYALLGRASAELGRHHEAARAYERVRQLWADPAAAAARLKQGERDPAAAQRRLGRALTAVGEAQFYFAEQKRARADRVTFPVYRGPGTKEAVLRHVNSRVAAWIKTKRPLLEEATVAYRRIVAIRPAPPPRWVIAAGARVGRMWAAFVKEFRDAPIPDSIRNDPELRALYYDALDRASEPQKQFAKQEFETCLQYSATYQYFDRHSRSCEEWLSETYPSDHHLLDEFRSAPTRLNRAADEHAPALAIGGTPL